VATTDPEIARRFLDVLTEHGIGFAVLHGEDSFEETTSDVDVVAARPPADILQAVEKSLQPLAAIMYVRYEPGGSAAVFLATPDLSEGAQIDLLYDPAGRGGLGFLSDRLLAEARPGRKYPIVPRPVQLAYLIRKRAVKAQAERLPPLIAEAASISEYGSVINGFSSRRAARSIWRVLEGQVPHRPEQAPFSASHLIHRIQRPAGCWIHCPGRNQAQELTKRARRILPRADMVEIPNKKVGPLWWWRHIEPYRIRPGVVATWGELEKGRLDPDVLLASGDGLVEAVAGLTEHARQTAQ
jgi:hypothetical protein